MVCEWSAVLSTFKGLSAASPLVKTPTKMIPTTRTAQKSIYISNTDNVNTNGSPFRTCQKHDASQWSKEIGAVHIFECKISPCTNNSNADTLFIKRKFYQADTKILT